MRRFSARDGQESDPHKLPLLLLELRVRCIKSMLPAGDNAKTPRAFASVGMSRAHIKHLTDRPAGPTVVVVVVCRRGKNPWELCLHRSGRDNTKQALRLLTCPPKTFFHRFFLGFLVVQKRIIHLHHIIIQLN